MRLDQADRIMLGDREVSRVYLGTNLVWTSEFSPVSLFAQGEPGVWYDPSDFSTMFQDAAGNVPVTAVEQPVGRMLDKSGRGNHAFQTTATSRPVLSARVNLLTKTEDFTNAVWNKRNNISASLDFVAAFDGSLTASTLTRLVNKNYSWIQQCFAVDMVSTNYTFSVYLKAGTTGIGSINIQNSSGVYDQVYVAFDLLATPAQITNAGTVGAGVYVSSSITSVGNDWYKLSLTGRTGVNTAFNGPAVYVGTNTQALGLNLYVWGASLVPANQSSLPYQRVNTVTDYDTAGFPHYLRFDGVDDWLVTNTITPGIDKVQVFAGVRKLSDVTQIYLELSDNINYGLGRFQIIASKSDSIGISFASRGTTVRGAALPVSGFAAPVTGVVIGLGDISGDSVILRVNGTQAAISTADQGTGKYLAYPLYIGRRGGKTAPFNGHLYSLIVRFGSNLPIETIGQAETWINSKTGAY